MNTPEKIVSAQCKLGEGPVWHPDEQALYWLDILQHQMHRYDPASRQHDVTDLGMLVSAMGLRAGEKAGGFVMATRRGFAFWSLENRQFALIADPDPDASEGQRFNDGKTDPQGRFWAGKMSGKAENSLFRLDPDGSVQRMERGIGTSNGLGWSPDGATFYHTDSPARKIYAYDYDPASGAIHNRRVFADIPDHPGEGIPDGLAVDSQGSIYSARWGGWKVVHYDPDGQVVREIELPVEYPTSCAFGGPDLRCLYITSAWVECAPEARAQQPQAGDLFRLRVDVPGLPEPFFAG